MSTRFSDETKRDLVDLIMGALPMVTIGALTGAALHVGSKLVDAPSQRNRDGIGIGLAGNGGRESGKSGSKSNDICSHYKHLLTDDTICKNIRRLVPFSVINPDWLPIMLNDANLIYAAWFRMAEINREALELIPNHEYFVGPVSGLGHSSTLFDYVTGFFGNVSNTVSNSIRSAGNKAANNGGGGKNALASKGDAYAAATRRLKQLIEEANDILSTVSVCRNNTAGYSSEFFGLCKMFNVYWTQCGMTFIADPDVYHGAEAKSLVNDQFVLVKRLRKTGRLPYELPNDGEVCETPNTMNLARWWTLMYATFLPTMYHAVCRLGWYSAYNPKPQAAAAGSSSSSSYTEPSNEESDYFVSPGVRYKNNGGSRAGGKKSSSALDAEFRSRAIASSKSAFAPGHCFLQGPNQAKEEAALASQLSDYRSGGAGGSSSSKRKSSTDAQEVEARWKASRKMPQSTSVKRPSANSSFYEQGAFWVQRLKAEGWRSVLGQPWAGFMPSVNDACFLPTAELNIGEIGQILERIAFSLDRRITDMFNTNHRLAELGVKFYKHWHPSVFEQDEEMAMHVQKFIEMEHDWHWNEH